MTRTVRTGGTGFRGMARGASNPGPRVRPGSRGISAGFGRLTHRWANFAEIRLGWYCAGSRWAGIMLVCPDVTHDGIDDRARSHSGIKHRIVAKPGRIRFVAAGTSLCHAMSPDLQDDRPCNGW